MTPATPPPMLACARVIAYAQVDASIPFLARTILYVDGELLGRVPCLAICKNLGNDDGDALLFHCDEQWNVLGVSGDANVEAVMLAAERNYPGLEPHWIRLDTTHEEAVAYYDAAFGTRCSFCGRRAYEFTGFVERESAVICRECVEMYARAFATDDDKDS